MIVRTTPKLSTGRMVVAMVHTVARCREREKAQIGLIRDSQLPISEWWSYLHTADRQKNEPYAPPKLTRHTYDPEHGQQFQATPTGNRFIVVGGGVADRVPELFAQLCRVNTRRFVDLEFHFPLDAIGTNSFGADKLDEAFDYLDRYRLVLREMSAQRCYGSELYFDGELMPQYPGRLNIYVQWHETVRGMIASLSQGPTIH